ncbi:MAG: hypothetical protein WBA54_07785 [Acidaminobacteraceae bacterium]
MLAAKQISEFNDYNDYKNYIHDTHVEAKKQQFQIKKEKESWIKRLASVSRTIFAALLMFAALALVVVIYANVYELKYNNYEYQKEIGQYKIEIEDLKSQLDSVVVLENIEKVAMEELNMQYPRQEQIIYINSNWNYKLDEVKSADSSEPVSSTNFIEGTKNIAALINNLID